ncbi:MAG: hypothetical protein M0Z46_02355 [Actinomycetota bacterium]|nr:hypothetical protein [Actinomycetota bacterium]
MIGAISVPSVTTAVETGVVDHGGGVLVEDVAATGPPGDVVLTLEQALDLLAALEDARDVLVGTDHLSVLAQVEGQIQRLSRKLGFDEGGSDVI